jgi:dTDP-4-amino-4,6-dideoxygalactose transaminase
VAEQAAREVLSLPLYPELADGQARAVASAVRELAARA